MTNTPLPADGTPRAERSTFRQSMGVAIEIDAPPQTVWSLLTDVAGFPSWNSQIDTLEGDIADGGQVAMTVPYAPGRTFKVKVRDVKPNESMVWADGFAPMFRGVRTFTLTPVSGRTRFEMVEVMFGAMLPMIRGSLPDFAPAFEAYAADLKTAAEAR